MVEGSFAKLRLAGQDHAIQEVIFTLFLAGSEPIDDPAGLETMKDDLGPAAFDTFRTTRTETHLFQLGTDPSGKTLPSMAVERPRDTGFSFEKLDKSGRLRHRLSGANGERSWLAVNLLYYDGWDVVFPKVIEWFSLIGKRVPAVAVSGVALHYVDLIYWDCADPLPKELVFRPDGLIPERLMGEASAWRFTFSYQEDGNDGVQGHALDIQLQKQRETGHQRVYIGNPMSLMFGRPVAIGEALSQDGCVPVAFNRLHDDIKKNLRETLTERLSERMGLGS